jgi:hypothetical protein
MTTHRSTWKSRERAAAALFGSRRAPLSGSNGGVTASDSLHPTIFLECKLRARSPIHRLFDQTADLAKTEGKVPCLCLAVKGRPGFLIVCKAEDIPALASYMVEQEDGGSCPCGRCGKRGS